MSTVSEICEVNRGRVELWRFCRVVGLNSHYSAFGENPVITLYSAHVFIWYGTWANQREKCETAHLRRRP